MPATTRHRRVGRLYMFSPNSASIINWLSSFGFYNCMRHVLFARRILLLAVQKSSFYHPLCTMSRMHCSCFNDIAGAPQSHCFAHSSQDLPFVYVCRRGLLRLPSFTVKTTVELASSLHHHGGRGSPLHRPGFRWQPDTKPFVQLHELWQ